MIQFIKKYKAFFIALIIIPIIYLLDLIGFLNVPTNRPFEVFLVTLFWFLVIALPIHNYHYLKHKKKTFIKIGILLLLFFFALLVDTSMKLPDNPITFILLTGFWLGIAYLLVPSFILKYWKFILFLYLPLFIYFLYLRLFSGDLEAYLKIKENSPFYIFFIPIPLFFFLWVFEQWKWLQNLKAEKTKTELSLLRTQINPHFFFNTLNNLYALTVKNSKQAPEVILKLSDMMRYTIYEGENEKVSIKEEITYLKNYIELHKIRYKKTVDILFNHNVDPELHIAPLLFIILLENAFKHGIETLTEDAFVHINLYESNNYICFDVENNFDSKEINKSNGIGLNNLKKRLSLLYNNQHEFSIKKTENIYKTTLKIKKHV
ncbi:MULTISPECIES: sensor histidine kinase [unclassified Tenacibaculum]|uniref:sensor histidine kinase n=1 Tax=unclassified Tenacibaculum TaxID=2635139 RepID=UPI001F2532FA|nr:MULTISPECIES: histidine kinase [unclassified Tenacibaculum]MCF2875114.1 histidine kinase [Tenacibaculum sp. Cn5-1]MCF2935190.1 histidine kinase [Tenacibaculum sp. Cn5-34]MCG7511368.1 histidine kinase [Tenacibaculum sp. Cn5-46]